MQKAAKQKNKKQGGVLRLLLRLAVVLTSAYLLVSFVVGQVQLAEKEKELAAVTLRLEQQKVQNEELEQLMESGDEDAYVERVAREKLGYARPDERVFVDISGK